jgi:hypothetical protein
MRYEQWMLVAEWDGECLIWPGRIDRWSYGRVGNEYAHRRAWKVARGPIPDGMTIDHLCFRPSCVNVDHLALATFDENRRRNQGSLATHCIHGHEFSVDNTYLRSTATSVWRGCRACNREAVARYKLKRASA